MQITNVKVDDLLTTVTNGFDGEVKVVKVIRADQDDLDYGCVMVGYPDTLLGGMSSTYVRLSACKAYEGDEPIGTVVGQKSAVPMPW